MDLCTVIDHGVDGQHTQWALVGGLAGVHERRLRSREGYRSGRFLAGLDGRRVLSVVRWRSEADLAAFEASGDHAVVMAEIQHALDQLPGLVDTRIDRFHVLRHVEPRPETGTRWT